MNAAAMEINFDSLSPGPEMDLAVAELVFHAPRPVETHAPHIDIVRRNRFWYCLPDYAEGDVCKWEVVPFSRNMDWAWKVVEKICTLPDARDYFAAWFGKSNLYAYEADLAAYLICRTALYAVST